MGNNSFAPFALNPNHFVTQNVSPVNKTIKIFNYPITHGAARDLMQIKGVSEADIRASLLKGELNHKIRSLEIIVLASDIDLLQFNDTQYNFLSAAGVSKGMKIGPNDLGFKIGADQLSDDLLAQIQAGGGGGGGGAPLVYTREQVIPVGIKNSSNTIFYTPQPFINGTYIGSTYKIFIQHNGRTLYENIDYTVSASTSLGTNVYDTFTLTSFAPKSTSQLFCSYTSKP